MLHRAKGFTEHMAGAHPLNREIEGRLRNADPRRRNADPTVRQRRQRDGQPASRLSERIRAGD
jgi:hypothetical protein